MSHPTRKTILFNSMAISNEKEAVSHLKWIADMVAEKVKETPQTIVSCNTFNDTLTNLSYLLLVLKEKAFIDKESGKRLRRIPLNVRAISAKNIYQKPTHSTVTF